MFSTLFVFCSVSALVAFGLACCIAHEAVTNGTPIWKEFYEGTSNEWTAVGICQGVITLVGFAVAMPINHYVLAPSPPQKHEVVELDRVYGVNFPFNASNLTITFDTSKRMYYEEEGFEFEWVEGEEDHHAFELTSAQVEKIQKEMELNTGKRHTLTHVDKKLVSFYPNE
jgi:hypothetical protein